MDVVVNMTKLGIIKNSTVAYRPPIALYKSFAIQKIGITVKLVKQIDASEAVSRL